MNYIDIIEQEEDSSLKVEEPVVSMDLQRTLDLFERHHDPHACIDNAMTWDEFESEMDERINRMFDEIDSHPIARVS